MFVCFCIIMLLLLMAEDAEEGAAARDVPPLDPLSFFLFLFFFCFGVVFAVVQYGAPPARLLGWACLSVASV